MAHSTVPYQLRRDGRHGWQSLRPWKGNARCIIEGMKSRTNPADLKQQIDKMEEDFWFVQRFVADMIIETYPSLKATLDYPADLNEFAWVHRVVGKIVEAVFEDDEDRHSCPICGEGTAPTRAAPTKGYTRVGFERHLTGFGNQYQCPGMRVLQRAVGHCIRQKKKATWRPFSPSPILPDIS